MRVKFGVIGLLVCLWIAPSPAVAATIGLTGAIGGALVSGSFQVGSTTVVNCCGTNDWPGGEHPGLAIDGIVPPPGFNKYLNFFEANSGLIVSPTGPNASLPVTALSLWTANDAEERDPSSFHIYGSPVALTDATPGLLYSLASMTSIANLPIVLPATRNAGPTTVSFANSTAYASYLILFPTVKNSASANSMQFAELSLSGEGAAVVPEPSSLLLLAVGAGAWRLRRRQSGR